MLTAGSSPLSANNGLGSPGQMADRIRAFDWASTSLGPLATWPSCLIGAVELMLGIGFPATLQLGADAILLYNDAYIPVIGARHPVALGRSIFTTFPEIRDPYKPLFQRVLAGETIVFEDLPFRYFRDEHPIDTWFNMSYSPVRDEKGTVVGVLAIGFDTTARVALRESEERYRTLFDNIDDGCMIIEQLPLDPQGIRDYRYILMNPASTAMFNLPDVTGQTIRAIFPTEDQEWYDLYDRVIETGIPMRFERRASSQGMVLEMFLARVSEKRLLVLVRNVTDRRRAQDALRQAEKLAVVGRLASSIAHEINNPLEAVTNLIYLARSGDLSSNTATLLEQADKELRRVSLITTESLRFHQQQSQPSFTDLADLLDSILLLHEGRLSQSQITTERRYLPHPLVRCHPRDIRQVLANLVSNAIESMQFNRDRRLLKLRLRAATDSRTGQSGVHLTVADTGMGMTELTESRAFEPFFTTKEATNSGLGLWISREIVNKHHGRLRFRTAIAGPCRGTIFSLFLSVNTSG